MTNLPACQALRDRLVNGNTIKTRDLRDALSGDHWEYYQGHRENAKVVRASSNGDRTRLREYTKRLSVADRMFGLSERISNNRNKSELKRVLAGRKATLKPDGAQRLRDGEGYYWRALERLQELIYADPSIIALLDRPWDYGQENGKIAPDHESMPRPLYQEPESVTDSMMRVLDDALGEATTEEPEVMEERLDERMAHLNKLRKLMRR